MFKRKVNFGKRYTALLIDSQEQIALKIPMNEQKQIPNGLQSTTIDTETLSPYDEAEENYYQSVLSLNDLSYFPVHETVYQVYPKAHCSLITDVKQGTVSSATEINFL
ncbi:unnamed protein product [Adineta ricciae]|uniref:Uncharacterized protein n=1 Tax=Adineta ricciae TaxID=249248 RepID=A0A813V1G5_ADIRI|nr:unnamed protein product [Adineta ricciae]CAF1385815.1 unnamed protein product [Adineta ricciae]